MLNFLTQTSKTRQEFYQDRKPSLSYETSLIGGRIVGVQAGSDFEKVPVEIPDLVLNDDEKPEETSMYDLKFVNGQRELVKRTSPDTNKSQYMKNLIDYY